MLPTPEELREWSRQLREAARSTTDDTAKRRLANDALVLAQLAEAIAREGGVPDNKVETFKRLLAELLGNKTPWGRPTNEHGAAGPQRHAALSGQGVAHAGGGVADDRRPV